MQILQEQISAIHGGSTPASMRVTVIAGYVQFMSLAVNGTAVSSIALFLNEMTLAVLIAGRLILTMNKLDRIV